MATDIKLAVYRNNQRGRILSDLYDAHAVSIAVPYCAVVVVDKATANALRRVKVFDHYGTLVTGKLEELIEVLPEMLQHAQSLPDPSGWEAFCPDVGFRPLMPEQLISEVKKL